MNVVNDLEKKLKDGEYLIDCSYDLYRLKLMEERHDKMVVWLTDYKAMMARRKKGISFKNVKETVKEARILDDQLGILIKEFGI